MQLRNVRLPSREALIVLAGYGSAGVALLGTMKALTVLLPPVEYGRFALGLSAQILFVQLIFGPLASSVLRLAPDALQRSDLPVCLRAAQVWIRRALLGCGAASLVGGLALGSQHPEHAALYASAVLTALLYGTCQVYESLLSGTRHRDLSALSSGFGQILRSSGAIGVAFFCRRADAAMAGYLAGGIVSLVLSRWLAASLVAKLSPSPHAIAPAALARDLHFIASYGKPFLIWAGPTALQMTADRWLLQYFSGPLDVAVLTAAQQLAQLPVSFLFQFLQLFWAPILFGAHARAVESGAAHSRMLEKLGLLLFGGTFAGTLVLYLIGEALIRTFATPAYLRSAPFIPAIFLGTSLFQLGQWFALDQLSQKRSDLLIGPKIISSLLAIAGYAVAIRYDGLRGLATTTVGVGAFYLGAVLWSRRSLARS